MKKICLFVVGLLGATVAFSAEGDVGTQAFFWTSYRALDSVTYPNPAGHSLTNSRGKVILLDVFQYNCGGCRANAPSIGGLADSLGSGRAGIPFQAVGAEINNGTFVQIQTSFNTQLRLRAATVNFPLIHVPFDTAINADGVGTRWHRYNSYRDVYFVIDHAGVIRARVDGNRGTAMTPTQYNTLRTALTMAIANAPTGIRFQSRGKSGWKTREVSLQILDLQGRSLHKWTKAPRSALYFPR